MPNLQDACANSRANIRIKIKMAKDFAKKSKKNVIMLKIPLGHCDGGGWGFGFVGGRMRLLGREVNGGSL